MSLYIPLIPYFGSTYNRKNDHKRIPGWNTLMGVTTISHTNLLIYLPFPTKVNKLKTNKEYIVSKRLTHLVSRIWVEYKKSTNSLPDRKIWLKIEPFFSRFYGLQISKNC